MNQGSAYSGAKSSGSIRMGLAKLLKSPLEILIPDTAKE